MNNFTRVTTLDEVKKITAKWDRDEYCEADNIHDVLGWTLSEYKYFTATKQIPPKELPQKYIKFPKIQSDAHEEIKKITEKWDKDGYAEVYGLHDVLGWTVKELDEYEENNDLP